MSEKRDETTETTYENPEVVEIAKAEEITLGSCSCNPDIFSGKMPASTGLEDA